MHHPAASLIAARGRAAATVQLALPLAELLLLAAAGYHEGGVADGSEDGMMRLQVGVRRLCARLRSAADCGLCMRPHTQAAVPLCGPGAL